MTTRAITITAGAVALAVMLAALVASPAQAAAYRYWTYWQGSDSSEWEFSRLGPASAMPEDGDVEGWSFRVSVESGAAEAAPTTAADFDALCGGTPRRGGIKRIGLVVDPGDPALAPEGESPIAPLATCVTVEEDATGYDVLRSVLEVRTDNGLICGIGGYPARECAPVLDDATVADIRDRQVAAPGSVDVASATSLASASGEDVPEDVIVIDHGATDAEANAAEPASTSTSGPLTTILVVGALVLIGALLLLLRRRRERSDA